MLTDGNPVVSGMPYNGAIKTTFNLEMVKDATVDLETHYVDTLEPNQTTIDMIWPDDGETVVPDFF